MSAQLLLAATTGLLGGFGHCAAMCGPIVAALGLAEAPRRGARRALLGQLLYNAGRVTTYACVGAVMGLTGSFLDVAGRMAGLQSAAGLLAGGFMVLAGLAAAGAGRWVGPLRRLEPRLSGRVLGWIRRALRGDGDAGAAGQGGEGRCYALGLALGFLPCGLSYTAFLGAAAAGGLPQGLLFALVFALGTVPALLLVGAASALVTPRLRGALHRLGGAAVAALGVLFVLRGAGVRLAL